MLYYMNFEQYLLLGWERYDVPISRGLVVSEMNDIFTCLMMLAESIKLLKRWSVVIQIALNLAPVFQYQSIACTYLLLWHAPLRVLSTKRRHQSPEWTILSHISCFIQGEVTGFQVLLDSLHVVGGRPDGILQFSKRKQLRSSWHLFHLQI